MRFFLLMVVFGVVAIVLETTWFASFPTSSLHLDFIIIGIAALSFSLEWKQAIPVIVLYGIFTDTASIAPFGVSIFSYVIIYGFIRTIISKISFQAGLALLFWTAIVSLMDKFLCSLVLSASTGSIAIPRIIMSYAPAQALLDAAVGLLLVPFLNWYWSLSWEKITRPKGLVLK